MSTTSFAASKLDGFKESTEHDRQPPQCTLNSITMIDYRYYNLQSPNSTGTVGWSVIESFSDGAIQTDRMAVAQFFYHPKDISQYNKIGPITESIAVARSAAGGTDNIAMNDLIARTEFELHVGTITSDFDLTTATANTLNPIIEWTDKQSFKFDWNASNNRIPDARLNQSVNQRHSYIDTIFNEIPSYGIALKFIPVPSDFVGAYGWTISYTLTKHASDNVNVMRMEII